jgi:hypothetical protein
MAGPPWRDIDTVGLLCSAAVMLPTIRPSALNCIRGPEAAR